jgi:hypothetical protein
MSILGLIEMDIRNELLQDRTYNWESLNSIMAKIMPLISDRIGHECTHNANQDCSHRDPYQT